MKKEDWEEVEIRVFNSYLGAKLLVDGYTLTLRVLRNIKEMRLEIVPYVNGTLEGSWVLEDCEERRRFMRPVTISAWNAKARETMRKQPKSLLKKLNINPDEKLVYYSFSWLSFRPLMRHLIANNKNIELVGESIA